MPSRKPLSETTARMKPSYVLHDGSTPRFCIYTKKKIFNLKLI